MRAILVDDEKLALRQLQHILEHNLDGIEVVGVFSDPTQVIGKAEQLLPEVAFLDIHMPGISGLQLGEQLQERLPSTEIVFVTGYDQYAVHAFELHALDYIMKPVQLDRLLKTVNRLKARIDKNANKSANEPQAGPARHSPLICCFSQLRYQLHGEPSKPIKWRTSKAQELFAYLLHHRGRMIDRDTLIELLWPDFEAVKAVQQLYTTVYHIRQTLKSSGLETMSITSGNLEAGYRLTAGEARVDCDEWENRVKRLGALDAEQIEEYERVLELYTGNYFGDLGYLWAEHERERLRLLWLHHAKAVCAFRLGQTPPNLAAAIRINQRIQQLFPYEEESYFTLMKLYASMGERAGVEEQYWLLSSKLEQELESTVSEAVAAWYEQWRANP